MIKSQRWPARQRFVIVLTDVEGKHVTIHYGRKLRHLSVGTNAERVVYTVINGGWTAGVYKDGRISVDGKFPNHLFSARCAVTHFQEVTGYRDEDYQEAILSATEHMEKS